MPRLTHRATSKSSPSWSLPARQPGAASTRSGASTPPSPSPSSWSGGCCAARAATLTGSRAPLNQATAKLLEVTGANSLDELRARLLGMVDGDVRALDNPATSASGDPQGPPVPDPVVGAERH